MWTETAGESASIRSVYERAHETTAPFERREELTLSGPDVAAEFRTREYDHAKLHYRIGVDSGGRVKLLMKGHLWGDEDTHQRFRIQYRRCAEPTDTPPFAEYSAWVRLQLGTVHREDDSIRFERDPDRTREETRTLAWDEMYSSDQLRLAEAELVRNPPLARYALRQQDLWVDVHDALRYNPNAFNHTP
jgi:hypothetical protein